MWLTEELVGNLKGRVGELEKGRLTLSPILPFSHSQFTFHE
jgi:hypothetical protein